MDTYTAEDIFEAECNLEPLQCMKCGSLEVTYNQYIMDAFCADCGTWQEEYEEEANERSELNFG